MSTLQLHDVRFAYAADPVIAGVTLRVEPGEVVALLGPNGAGKSTLTRLIMGLLHPSHGEILVMGVPNMEQLPEQIARDAAYVFQHADQQLFSRTVIEEVAFAPLQLGRSRIDARDIAFHALLDLGLEAQAAVHPYDLSPAERKLVALAAALAQQPHLLILDEPTQGLDATLRDRVCETLRRLAGENVAILFVSHDLGVVAEIADRAVVMERGAIVADRPVTDLLADAQGTRALGMPLPPAAGLSLALKLPGTPVRKSQVVQALKRR